MLGMMKYYVLKKGDAQDSIEVHCTSNLCTDESGKNIILDVSLVNFNFDLAKTMDLPDSLTPYCKAIKDTLWEHCMYRYFLDHLTDCVLIDVEHDICSGTAAPSKAMKRTPSFKPKALSVVNIIISMNTKSNPPSESAIQHIASDSTSASYTVTILSFEGFSVVDHIPDETLNQKVFDELQKRNLRVTRVSDKGLNCMINAIIQHAKKAYDIPFFEESEILRSELESLYPSKDLTGMLHCDDKYAESLLLIILLTTIFLLK